MKKKDKEKGKIMEERVKLAEKVKQKAIAEADKAKDEYLAMAGYKTPDANTEIDAGESKKVTGTKLA